MPRYARAARGFSLVEMLIGMAVVAVLVTLAAPGFRKMLIKQQVDSAANDLLADLQTARGLAISRGRLVGVLSAAGGWRQGWRIQAVFMAAIYSANQGRTVDPLRGCFASVQLSLTTGAMGLASVGWGALVALVAPGVVLAVPGAVFVVACVPFALRSGRIRSALTRPGIEPPSHGGHRGSASPAAGALLIGGASGPPAAGKRG